MLSPKEQQIIVDSMKPYQPTKIGVFGSVARGEERTDSDVDIAYSFDGYFGFFELEDLIEDLEKKLNRKVDLVKFDCLNPIIKESILNDMILLCDEKTLCR
ncbi:MAG: nucleotidyltransferase domain-containing protein [Flavobacteriaceae bacterium]|nr:nucleotidyltransferase domain-containing protein [Flavobacteriaceae bacterium]MCY4267765.1 nucleotidyltransferase domain-containing protein [Flavobacteriaceae bacterium]MCY4299413.1 nucleotidyltransferase domain-containing protein [Flavobacteriaceae bacterium]